MTIRSRSQSSARRQTANNFGELIGRHANGGTAAETAYAVLREAILSNILSPGVRLRADEIAKKLGVSKTPVREALRKLEAEDLVVSAGNALMVKVLSEQQLLEIYYTREALEGMAARLAAENAGAVDLTHLRAIVQDIEVARADSDALRRFTGEFQLAVFKAARNDYLYGLLSSIQEKIRHQRTSTVTLAGRDAEVASFCRELLQAIEKRDADAAERIARANRRRTLELRLKMMRGTFAAQR
ncbi:MAG TPA: GntR family transcriptional regulator [Pseudolabrys sp.]|nr:GntR family transcriptional regulator [Pseudolabrys sp.]